MISATHTDYDYLFGRCYGFIGLGPQPFSPRVCKQGVAGGPVEDRLRPATIMSPVSRRCDLLPPNYEMSRLAASYEQIPIHVFV